MQNLMSQEQMAKDYEMEIQQEGVVAKLLLFAACMHMYRVLWH